MFVDVFPLVLLGSLLLLWFGWRWRYRLKCPECGHRAQRGKMNIGYQLERTGKKKEVEIVVGMCIHCNYSWTLRTTVPSKSNLVIPSGTGFRHL